MPQIIDPNDDFTLAGTGLPNYNLRPLAWLGCRPNTTAYEFTAHLYDSYNEESSALGFDGAVAACGTSSAPHTGARAWVYRRPFQEDVSITASFYEFVDIGSANADLERMEEFGVLARISRTGTLQNAGDDVHVADVDGYVLSLRGQSDDTVDFTLERYNAGTATSLASLTLSASNSAAVDWSRPFELRLDLTDDGANTDYVAWFQNLTLAGEDGFGPIRLFEGTDTSPIQVAGRAGISMPPARTYTSPAYEVASICQWIQVADSTNPQSVFFRDEWVRYSRHQMQTNEGTPDRLGRSGRLVQGFCTWDQFSAVDAELDAASDAIDWDAPSGAGYQSRLFLSYRASDRIDNHARAVDLTITPTSATEYSGGVACFVDYKDQIGIPTGTGGTFNTPNVYGYLGCIHRIGGSWSYMIRRARGLSNGFQDLLASESISAPSFPIKIELRARVLANQDIELKLFVDDTQRLVSDVHVDVTVDGNGTVIDFGATRVIGGLGEAMFAGGNDIGSDTTFVFDNWEQTTLALVDTETIVVADEGTVSGTINDILAPHFSVQIRYSRPQISTRMSSGHTASRPEFSVQRRYIRFSAPYTTPQEHRALESFYDLKSAIEGAFNYTDFGGTDIPVRFVPKSLKRTRSQAPNVFGTEFELEELLNVS